MATMTQVLKDVQTLGLSDKKKVFVALKSLIGDVADAPKKGSASHEDIFYEILSKTIKRVLRQNLPPFKVFKAGTTYTALALCVQELDEFLDSLSQKPSVKREIRIDFYQMFLTLSAKNLQQNMVPLSVKTLLESHTRFPALIDREFPGYLSNGLFFQILGNGTI